MICPSCRAENDEAAEVCFTCRTVLSPVTQGVMLADRFEILSPLGKGGMGAVYKVRDRVLDEVMALKILRADVAGSPEMAERFRSEIKLARRVSHFNVCRIHEYGTDGRLQFISMELIEGESLKDRLQRGPLPPATAFDLAIQVADGLAAVHRGGVIHRDLKSLNIMVDVHGTARLMDFGIAKRVTADRTAYPHSSGYVMGTPEYMSPEQARGQGVDARSDLYSLGILIFEMFTGRVPFRGDTPVATLLMHLETPPPLEGGAAAALPPSLVPVLRRALAKEPGERYASATEMAEALRSAQRSSQGEPAARPTPRLPRSHRRLNRAAIAGTAALAATIALAVVVVALRRGESPPRDSKMASSTLVPAPTLTAGTPAATRPIRDTHERPIPRSGGRPTASTVSDAVAAVPLTAPQPSPSAPPEMPPPRPSSSSATAVAATALPSPPSPSSEGSVVPETGALNVAATPWADVLVDGKSIGQTPLARVPLSIGRHDVVLIHPLFQPYRRRITIRSGETFRLAVDLEREGVPLKK